MLFCAFLLAVAQQMWHENTLMAMMVLMVGLFMMASIVFALWQKRPVMTIDIDHICHRPIFKRKTVICFKDIDELAFNYYPNGALKDWYVFFKMQDGQTHAIRLIPSAYTAKP